MKEMELYPKIDSIYKRYDNGKFKDEFSCEAFEYLKDNKWVFTEKIDGTNIRIGWDGKSILIGGRTDRAQIPTHLSTFLQSHFRDELFSDYTDGITLFGEGYGFKIQNGGGYIPDGVGFILFDVLIGKWWLKRELIGEWWLKRELIGKWWLKREDVESVAEQLEIPVVPIIESGTLSDACRIVMNGFDSRVGKCKAEGLVLRPAIELKERDGRRIITKVKTRDFL